MKIKKERVVEFNEDITLAELLLFSEKYNVQVYAKKGRWYCQLWETNINLEELKDNREYNERWD